MSEVGQTGWTKTPWPSPSSRVDSSRAEPVPRALVTFPQGPIQGFLSCTAVGLREKLFLKPVRQDLSVSNVRLLEDYARRALLLSRGHMGKPVACLLCVRGRGLNDTNATVFQ
jgi:hypothetical protein